MIKKGDMVSIALIMANMVFVCLLVAKGSFIAPDAGSNNSSLPTTIIPDIMLTVTARPSPDMTLAVNEGALLFAEIRSQPRQEPSAPSISPSPSPTPSPDADNDDDIIESPVKRPSYTPTPPAITPPSYHKGHKARPKHP